MNEVQPELPDGANDARPRSLGVARQWLLILLSVGAAIALLVALLVPAIRFGHDTDRRGHCVNNVKQITLGLMNYSSRYQALPPAYTVDAKGKPLHSWRTLLLPFIDQESLYERIDLTKPWNDPANAKEFETPVAVYTCPTSGLDEGQTTYLAVVGQDACFLPTESRKLLEIKDSRDLTMMLIEVDAGHSVQWMSPRDTDEDLILSLFKSSTLPHESGAAAASVGGRVFDLGPDTHKRKIHAMISISGDDDGAFLDD